MTFSELITPSDPDYLAIGRRLFAERQDLREAFGSVDALGFRKWLAVSGALEYPEELGRYFPPIPPEDLRRTGCGGSEAHGHLYSAMEDFEVVCEAWRLYGNRPMAELTSVLDFGCGCGRTARWFAQTLPATTVHGCDVRKAGVDWCDEHLRGSFDHTSTSPPLPYADDSMDVVYALSLFSHFERASADSWMKELARVCRPDGRLIVTTHGAFSAWVLARSEVHQQSFFVDADGAAELARRLQEENFVFHEPPADWLARLDGPTPDYGQSFCTEGFVRESWGADVEIVATVPAALSLFQDLYVLKPTES